MLQVILMLNPDPRAREQFVWIAAGFVLMFAEVLRYVNRHPGSAYIETEEQRQAGGKQALEFVLKRKLTGKESQDLSTVMDVASIQQRGIAGIFDLDRRSRKKG